MPTTTRFRVEGLRELGEAFKALTADMQGKTGRATTNAMAQVIKKKAIQNIRQSPSVDRGDLIGAVITKRVPPAQTALTSEHIVTVRGRGKPTTKAGKRRSLAPHARFVEFGTVNMPAEPFLRPAIEQNQTEALEAGKKRLKARIDKANRGGK